MPYKDKDKARQYHAEYMKKYRLENKGKIKDIDKRSKLKRKTSIKEYNKIKYLDNKEENQLKSKLYNKEHKVERREYSKLYEKENRDLINKRVRDKRKTNLLFSLEERLRASVNRIFRSLDTIKDETTFEIVGCNVLTVKKHIERQFTEGMSWENRNKWDIDHKVPLHKGKTIEEKKELCHYTNLQPLWSNDNKVKGIKLPDNLQLKITI